MQMKCPYCQETGGLTEMHHHLGQAHPDTVGMRRSDDGVQTYIVSCPFCGFEHVRPVNPRGRNPRFMEEYRAEIALVAFDQLLYHLLQEHPAELGVDAGELA
ncbi:MAG: hypothetical protein ACE5M4_04450 [Anaerolineales bacterium]